MQRASRKAGRALQQCFASLSALLGTRGALAARRCAGVAALPRELQARKRAVLPRQARRGRRMRAQPEHGSARVRQPDTAGARRRLKRGRRRSPRSAAASTRGRRGRARPSGRCRRRGRPRRPGCRSASPRWARMISSTPTGLSRVRAACSNGRWRGCLGAGRAGRPCRHAHSGWAPAHMYAWQHSKLGWVGRLDEQGSVRGAVALTRARLSCILEGHRTGAHRRPPRRRQARAQRRGDRAAAAPEAAAGRGGRGAAARRAAGAPGRGAGGRAGRRAGRRGERVRGAARGARGRAGRGRQRGGRRGGRGGARGGGGGRGRGGRRARAGRRHVRQGVQGVRGRCTERCTDAAARPCTERGVEAAHCEAAHLCLGEGARKGGHPMPYLLHV